MDYHIKPFQATPEVEYIEYLLCRLMEFRRAGSRLGQTFSIPLTLRVTRLSVEKQLGCQINDATRFAEICAHIQSKIENTILGRQNTAKGWRCYHSFGEDRTAEVQAKSRATGSTLHPKNLRPLPAISPASPAATPQNRAVSIASASGDFPAPAPLTGAETFVPRETISPPPGSSDGQPISVTIHESRVSELPAAENLSADQLAVAARNRVLLLQAQPLMEAGVADFAVARTLGVSAATLSRVLNLAAGKGSASLTSKGKCRRLLELPMARLAPSAPKYKESDFAPLLQVKAITDEINRLYAASLGASGPQAMNDHRTGSVALTLKRLGDFPTVPPVLAEKLRAGSQPKPMVDFIKRTWTPEMEAKFRGQKHYNQSTIVGRRDLIEEFADGSTAPLKPGRVWVFDDMSSNLPFWFECDAAPATITDRGLRQLVERHGVALGRQGLYAWDWASGAWLGVELVGRLRDAYRASDILRFIRKLVMLYGKPDKIILERGTWQSRAISGWSLDDSLVEVEDGWQRAEMAGDETAKINDGIRALGIEVIHTYTSRGKPIEGAFNYLQSIVPTMLGRGEAMNIGRHRGEFEWAGKQHLRASEGILHPRDLRFIHIDRLADLTLEAMTWDGQHDKARRSLQTATGETSKPLEILASFLQGNPLPQPSAQDLAVFLPEKRNALIRGGVLTASVNGEVHQFLNPELFAALGDATRVDYAFDPDEPTLGAAVYSARGFIGWASYLAAGPVISARDRSQDAGPQMIKAYKSAHRTAFRALDLKSLRPVIMAERRDGHGRVATMTNQTTTATALPVNGRAAAAPMQRVDNSRFETRRRQAQADDALANLTD